MSVHWTSSNVIPYLNQLCDKYINYEIATSIVWMTLGLLLFLAGIVCYRIVYKNKDWGIVHYNTMPDDYTARGFIYIGVISIFMISMTMITIQILDIITCVTFPEKIIINELKKIQSNMN